MPATPAAAADHPELFAHFGAQDVPERSIYPYSPVFPCQINGQRAVLKRTRRAPADAAAVAAVTRQWAGQGVAVVAPLDLDVPNPVRLADGHWVAYPFVAGQPYRGDLSWVAAAGDLLGRVHAATGPARLPAFAWPDHDQASVDEDATALRTVVAPHAAEPVVARLVDLVRGFMADVLTPVRAAGLPCVNAVMDYKANNLIYTAAGPVLVDPDNGDYGPRLLDLAQALLLFHTEHEPAPPRLFDAAEWSAFSQAYLRHVELTEPERALWPVAVEYQLSEEGHWALTNDPQEWHEPRQRSFLLALAAVRAADYPLPAAGADHPLPVAGR